MSLGSNWGRWVEGCSRTEDALSVAIVRVAIGLIVAGHVVHLAWSGALPLVWFDADHGGLRDLDEGALRWAGGAVPAVVVPVCVGTVVSALAMALGLTRWATWATWLGFQIIADLNGQAGGSYDELLTATLFLLGWSGAHRRLSVLRFFARPGSVADTSSLACVRWLLVLQLVVMYTSSAIQKVSAHWVPWGDHMALWYILQQPTWQRNPMLWVAPFAGLTRVATVTSWMFELTAPLLLVGAWFRETRTRAGVVRSLFNRLDVRRLQLLVGLGMHIGIEATMEVGAFSLASLALYVACFSPDELRRAAS
ncbi:MAG: hypothetical protein EXR69_07215 [Myxococcales bacterium]|nr:hypothetical protein [Myxococcales bacterium]